MKKFGFWYCSTLKDSARANQLDCVISYFFQLYLILYVYVRKFDETDTIKKFWEVVGACISPAQLNHKRQFYIVGDTVLSFHITREEVQRKKGLSPV